MGSFLNIVSRLINGLSKAAGVVAAVCIGTACAITTYGVVMRYAFNKPPIFVEEVSGYLLLAVVFLGIVYAERHGAHIKITILTSRLSKRLQNSLEAITLSLGLVLVVLLIKWAWQLWLYKFGTGVISVTSLHTPLWIPVTVIVIALPLFGVQLIRAIGQRIIALRDKD